MSQGSSHSRAFFLELVLNLVLFTLCAAVCLQVFAQAKIQSDTSSALSRASLQSQSIAEVFKASGGDLQQMSESLRGEIKDGTLYLHFDENNEQIPSGDAAVLQISCAVSEQDGMKTAEINSVLRGKEIYSLQAKAYVKGGEQ